LIIKESQIQGLGLFALIELDAKIDIGITHIFDPRFIHNYSRTPLGGFYNHSNIPNIFIEERKQFQNKEIHCRVMVTLNKIKKGEELIAQYSLYDVTDFNHSKS
jgi:hypothetical protein|tara:strand:- start:211 stop:522 length:312 start_codon:yes stop_codon:yes gene_type:complete